MSGLEGENNNSFGSQTPEGFAQKGESVLDALDRQGFSTLTEYAGALMQEAQNYADDGIRAELRFNSGGQAALGDVAYNVFTIASARDNGKSWEDIEAPGGVLSRARVPEDLYAKLKELESGGEEVPQSAETPEQVPEGSE